MSERTLSNSATATSESAPTSESVSSLSTSVATLKGTVCDPHDFPTLSAAFSKKKFADSTLIVTISHGETVDSIFPNWLKTAYPKDGRQPFVIGDLNMPSKLPRRPRDHYATDGPLTMHGKTVAAIIGTELASASSRWKQRKPAVIYSAPEMRCVETAKELAEKMGVKIRVEPALCDWRMFAERGAHEHWLSVKELHALKYNVDTKYKPTLEWGNIPLHEKPAEYATRLINAYECITKTNPGAPVIVVAHPTTIFMTEDGRWSLDKHLVRIDKQIGTCEVSGIEVNAKGEVTHRQIVNPFTRNLHDARELQRLR